MLRNNSTIAGKWGKQERKKTDGVTCSIIIKIKFTRFHSKRAMESRKERKRKKKTSLVNNKVNESAWVCARRYQHSAAGGGSWSNVELRPHFSCVCVCVCVRKYRYVECIEARACRRTYRYIPIKCTVQTERRIFVFVCH